MRLLIVEDHRRLAAALKAIAEEAGYSVDLAYDGEEGINYAGLASYDAIVLDVMLPKLDGFEVISVLRKQGNDTPVIMLTARDSINDKIRGLDLGADDYLAKPFIPAELLARLRALARRQGTVVLDTICLGNTILNLETAAISTKSSEEINLSVQLSQREFEVMKLLIGLPGRSFSKMDILERVWGLESEAEENSVEVYISFLRKKLAHVGSDISIITTRSIGYRIEVNNA